ncbi:MAG: cupin domain-containing protein [Actinomycetota bacterium]
MAPQPTFNPAQVFLHMDENGEAHRLDTSQEGFWSALGEQELDGRLVGLVRMSQSTSWEMHPGGDEMLFLLSGAIDVIVDDGHGEDLIPLTAGRMCIVPRHVWHRQVIKEPGDLLFVTPGPSTEHRSLDEHRALRGPSDGR